MKSIDMVIKKTIEMDIKKKVQSNYGDLEISIPKDRNSTFKTIIVPKISQNRKQNNKSVCLRNDHKGYCIRDKRTV